MELASDEERGECYNLIQHNAHFLLTAPKLNAFLVKKLKLRHYSKSQLRQCGAEIVWGIITSHNIVSLLRPDRVTRWHHYGLGRAVPNR
jgi:hypothetical protein